MTAEERNRFFDEVEIALRKRGIEARPTEAEDNLEVLFHGEHLCHINEAGGIGFYPESIKTRAAKEALEVTRTTAEITAQYMQAMETALPIVAGGLSGDYRLLADFGGTLLAGHPTKFGVEFVTWDWTYNREGVCNGHYFDYGGFQAAKQDFALRSGLIPREKIFSKEQYALIYKAAGFYQNMFDTISEKEKQRLEEIMENCERMDPELCSLGLQQDWSPQQPMM